MNGIWIYSINMVKIKVKPIILVACEIAMTITCSWMFKCSFIPCCILLYKNVCMR
ncbi:hypothetical protein F383_27551 [Gossypium arboreum]|uniref:Uncharacterized protein n=1 Tax=Gossypium arboreum TaxID=29729 RepID=A0A0B0MS60_GOSAR|nr:hypothetical protein F383_27551 [Gossypium arboreum]